MKKSIFVCLLVISLLVPSVVTAQAVRVTAAERRIAETIKADQLSNWLHFVASDAMGGRDTPSQGLDITAEFLKMKLSRWGFKPAGDNGTFFQRMNIKVESTDPAANTVKVGEEQFTLNSDFFRFMGNGSATAPMVFARHGWVIRSRNIDAYQGIDVKGKIIVIHEQGFPSQTTLTRMPEGTSNADLTGTKGTDWSDPLTYAAENGAAGIIVVASQQVNAAWPQIRNFFSRGSMYVEGLRDAGASQGTIPVVLASAKIANVIFAGESGNKDSENAFAINKTAAVTTASRTDTKTTQNVVALWEGRDPVLKNEMVALGAHYDHVGTNLNAPGPDKIWNGADDDGSGTVAILAIAEALAKSRVRPKRSVLFVWHAGEEKGLWGAEYFNKFPTVNIKNVIAQLNIDMIGRSKKPGDEDPRNKELSGPNEVYVIGAEMMSSTLGAITKGTNDAFLKLEYNYKYDDPKDPNRFFFRSDHFHYAVNGIPVAFWFTGVHEDYHQPGDHPDKIDYQKMEKITRTIFMTMWKLTDLRTRPEVDKQLPPELTQR
jgi:Zn-dependent M28 family amino/carboxypeptidase